MNISALFNVSITAVNSTISAATQYNFNLFFITPHYTGDQLLIKLPN